MKPEDFITQYETALRTQDWRNVAPLIHNDACVTFSSGTLHKGKQAIKAAFEYNFTLIKNEHYSVEKVHWVKKDNSMAVYLFEYFWKGIINGNLVEGNGIGTSVLVYENEHWILLTENLSKKG